MQDNYSDKLKLYLQFQKSFTTDLSKNELPPFLQNIELPKGRYVYGIGSNSDIDGQGERVVLNDNVASSLIGKKLYLEHDHKGELTGIAPIGMIEFSKIIPEMQNQHIIAARMNEAHPFKDNIWGSIQNGMYDAFSIGGNANKEFKFNPITHKHEIIRDVKALDEVSVTSMPANAGAGIMGTFVKNMSRPGSFNQAGKQGGFELFKTTNPEEKMENFVNMEKFDSLQQQVTKMSDLIGKTMDAVSKNSEQFTAMTQGLAEMKKALEDETKPTDVKKTEASKTDSSDILIKKMEELNGKVEGLQKSMSYQREGVSHNNSYIEEFQKTASNNETPLIDFIEGKRWYV